MGKDFSYRGRQRQQINSQIREESLGVTGGEAISMGERVRIFINRPTGNKWSTGKSKKVCWFPILLDRRIRHGGGKGKGGVLPRRILERNSPVERH